MSGSWILASIAMTSEPLVAIWGAIKPVVRHSRCMTSADPIDGIHRLRSLANDDLYKLVDPGDRAAVIGWGMTFNVIHFVDGIVQLHNAGNCFAAGPLRRAALEYSMTTVWLADARDEAANALNSGLQYKMGSLLDKMKEVDAVKRFPEDAIANAQAVKDAKLPKATQSNLLLASHLLDAYDWDEEDEKDVEGATRIPLLLVYDAESSFSHASLMGAQAFFRDTGKAIALGTKPEPAEFVPCLIIGLSVMFTSMLAYNELLISKPWTDTLQEVATDFGFGLTLPKRRPKALKERKPDKKR